ncbi:MAG: phosphoribosylformylglycinamidine synthase-associated small membrane protein [Hyphomicrobiaceae bacterium]
MAAPEAGGARPRRSDGAEAVRYLVIKAAIFILVPLIAAGLTVLLLLPK